jgi:hypothetical protein
MVTIVLIGQKLAERQARNCKADTATCSTRLMTRSTRFGAIDDAIQRRDLATRLTTRSNDAIQRRDLTQNDAIQRRDLTQNDAIQRRDLTQNDAIQRRDLTQNYAIQQRDPTTRSNDETCKKCSIL